MPIITGKEFLEQNAGYTFYWNGETFYRNDSTTLLQYRFDTLKNYKKITILDDSIVDTDNNKISKCMVSEYELFDDEGFCKALITVSPSYIQHMPNPSIDIYNVASTKYPNIVQHIVNPSEEICKSAVQQNGNNIQYIKNPSEEVCKLAIQQNSDATKYIKNMTIDMLKIVAYKENQKDDATHVYELSNKTLREIFENDEKSVCHQISALVNHYKEYVDNICVSPRNITEKFVEYRQCFIEVNTIVTSLSELQSKLYNLTTKMHDEYNTIKQTENSNIDDEDLYDDVSDFSSDVSFSDSENEPVQDNITEDLYDDISEFSSDEESVLSEYEQEQNNNVNEGLYDVVSDGKYEYETVQDIYECQNTQSEPEKPVVVPEQRTQVRNKIDINGDQLRIICNGKLLNINKKDFNSQIATFKSLYVALSYYLVYYNDGDVVEMDDYFVHIKTDDNKMTVKLSFPRPAPLKALEEVYEYNFEKN